MNSNTGWICPRCDKVHAPSVLTCDCVSDDINKLTSREYASANAWTDRLSWIYSESCDCPDCQIIRSGDTPKSPRVTVYFDEQVRRAVRDTFNDVFHRR